MNLIEEVLEGLIKIKGNDFDVDEIADAQMSLKQKKERT